MEDSAIIKPLREQFQICIEYLRSDECGTSQLNLTKGQENFGTDQFKFAQILQKISIIDV